MIRYVFDRFCWVSSDYKKRFIFYALIAQNIHLYGRIKNNIHNKKQGEYFNIPKILSN